MKPAEETEELALFRMQMRDRTVRGRPLDTAQATEVLRRVRLQHPPFPIKMALSDTRPLWLRFETLVPGRDDGAPVCVAHGCKIPEWLTEPHLIALVHSQLRRAFEHEADECFLYGGVRLFDPHAVNIPPERSDDGDLR